MDKGIALLKTRLEEAKQKLGEAQEMVREKTEESKRALERAQEELTSAKDSVVVLDLKNRFLVSRIATLETELAQAKKAKIAALEEYQTSLDLAEKQNAATIKIEKDLHAKEGEDLPLVRKWEKEVEKLERRIATKEAYAPLKALFPGGGGMTSRLAMPPKAP